MYLHVLAQGADCGGPAEVEREGCSDELKRRQHDEHRLGNRPQRARHLRAVHPLCSSGGVSRSSRSSSSSSSGTSSSSTNLRCLGHARGQPDHEPATPEERQHHDHLKSGPDLLHRGAGHAGARSFVERDVADGAANTCLLARLGAAVVRQTVRAKVALADHGAADLLAQVHLRRDLRKDQQQGFT